MNSGTTNTLSGLTIANGMALVMTYPGVCTYASGISNAGSLKLLNCVVRSCTNYLSYGVGIYNAGDMDMEASVVADCSAISGWGDPSFGGGIFNDGTLRMRNCRISRCAVAGRGMGGGGILNEGNLTMSESVIESCAAYGDGDGGGISNRGTGGALRLHCVELLFGLLGRRNCELRNPGHDEFNHR